jgi:hypothetical protein
MGVTILPQKFYEVLNTQNALLGDQFISSYDRGQIIWDVIGINHDIPTDKKYTTA